MLAKAYLLSLVQGFERIFWFEARGPAYGKGTDHGIIRPDWTPRPAYDAPQDDDRRCWARSPATWVGWTWTRAATGSCSKADKGHVLAAWSPAGKQHKIKFDAEVAVTDLAGKQSSLAAGKELVLTKTPVLIAQIAGRTGQAGARPIWASPIPGAAIMPTPRSSRAAWGPRTPRMASSRSIRRRRSS